MASKYSDSIKLEAENLWYKGHTIAEIQKALSKKKPGIQYSTIQKWVYTKNKKTNKNWDDYKQEIINSSREIVKNQNQNRYIALKQKAEILQDNLYKQLTETNLEVKSYEGGTYAFKTISEFVLLIEDKYEGKKTVKEVIAILIDTLNQVPEVRDAIYKNSNEIEKKLNERFNGDTLVK